MVRKKLTLQDCKLIAQNKQGKCLSFEYVNAKTKMLWQCKNGHEWYSVFDNVKNRGRWCYTCALEKLWNNSRLSILECIQAAIDKNGKCLSTEYKNAHTKLKWQCVCGYIWEADYNHIKFENSWCPRCSGHQKNTIEDCFKLAALKDGYCLSAEYKNNKTKMLWRCSKLHNWYATFHDIQSGDTWCPHCFSQISRGQKEIYEYLINIFSFPIILNDTQTIKPLDLDIHIPLLKVAIEYDGEYWHYSDWAIKNGSLETMARKDRICTEKSIKLLRIREGEWQENQELVIQSIIDFIDGVNNGNNNA